MHSAFIDDIGRLFMCGNGKHGQLGNGSLSSETTPYYINRIPDKAVEVACGLNHSIVLTSKGEIYAMGTNMNGELGIGKPSKGSPLPLFLEELSFSKIRSVRAGAFSGALSADGQLYVWGKGTFGEFYTPHRVKSGKTLEVLNFVISNRGNAAVLSR